MTELETMRFFTLLEMVEKDLAHLNTYHHDSKRVHTAAESALLGRDYQWREIAQRLHYLCIHLAQNLNEQEDLLTESTTWEPSRVKDRGDYT